MDQDPQLPDYLPGIPPLYGVKQQAPQFNQGDTIRICVPITLDGDTTLHVYLKDDLSSQCPIWIGSKDDGIKTEDGKVFIDIKAALAQTFPSGIYYLSVVGSKPNDVKVYRVLFQTTISINQSASSPYPIVQSPVFAIKPGQPTTPAPILIEYVSAG